MNNWIKIWNSRNKSEHIDDLLNELILVDGFDRGNGLIKKEDWLEYISWISEKCKINADDKIFEIGCGAGAFLYPFQCIGHTVGGIDYSEKMIELAHQLWVKDKNIELYCAEANNFKTNIKYDLVLSNSVFFYFPDYAYAEEVIKKMIDKSSKTIAILEVPDKALYDECEKMRRGAIGEQEYKIKYNGLQHLYFEKEWFEEIGNKYNLKTTIFNQNIANYGNSQFRFNCIYKKF